MRYDFALITEPNNATENNTIMKENLLRTLGNIQQIAGITETRLCGGRGEGIRMYQFYNTAGLRFSAIPDRGMDLFDFSYKGMNLSFQSKNGLVSPHAFSAAEGEFTNQWSGGLLCTCGLDNVGGHCVEDGIYPTHGRMSWMPAEHSGSRAYWDNNDYMLSAHGQVRLAQLYGRNLTLDRTIQTTLYGKSLHIQDKISNWESAQSSFMLLYHCNFGAPLLAPQSLVYTNSKVTIPLNDQSVDPHCMTAPVDGRGEELYLHSNHPKRGYAMLMNPDFELAVYVSFDSTHLPNMLEWKNMRSGDYVLALEPCNTFAINRSQAAKASKLAILPAFSFIDIDLEIGVLDGTEEIKRFIAEKSLQPASIR